MPRAGGSSGLNAAPHAETSFPERLARRVGSTGSRLCVGIDPRPAAHALTHPEAHGGDPARVANAVLAHAVAVLDAVHEVIACCKPQSAFFEALGLPGLEALAGVIAHARSLGLPVILDAKRGDIGSTAEAYAAAYLEDGAFGADALTINPFLGLDTLEPFISAALTGGRGLFVLVRTSNPGSAALQELALAGGELFYQRLARFIAERARQLPVCGRGYTLLGAVGGATSGAALADLRGRLPSSWLLVPGLGAQGASAREVAPAFDERGYGAVINASRAVVYPQGGEAARNFVEAGAYARRAVDALNSQLNAALQGVSK